ncbi:uncharacterized protein [Dysidea avara]|uniref:uncharacterized protein n=1 Tax=Dysidea avara TaxID=196820 RepID=UPI003323843E
MLCYKSCSWKSYCLNTVFCGKFVKQDFSSINRYIAVQLIRKFLEKEELHKVNIVNQRMQPMNHKMIVVFFFLWFISAATCQFDSVTECEKRCPIESTAGFDEDQVSGVHKNLSLCLSQNGCYNLEDCSTMLTKHYCLSGDCTVSCEMPELETNVPKRTRTKRLFHIHLPDFHFHSSASRPTGPGLNIVVAVFSCLYCLGNILL